MPAMAHLKMQPKFFLSAYELLNAIRPDLIIAHNFESMAPSALYRLKTSTPVLYVSREPYHKVFRLKRGHIIFEVIGWVLDGILAHLASKVITVTPRMVKMYKSMGVKAVLIPNCPTDSFLRRKLPKTTRDYINIGFIGNLRPDCGIEQMWEAIKTLNNGDLRYRLFLCGVPLGGMESVLEKMKKERAEAITIMRPVHPSRVPSIYAQIDIAFHLAMPNVKRRKYGLTTKIYEAFATGTPAIISSSGENLSLIGDINAALVIKDFTFKEIAEKVKCLGENEQLRKQMGESGRRFIETKFNWDIFSEHYKKMLEQLLEE
jgi:glycosyltransferase involved in cell wall biosynthesis